MSMRVSSVLDPLLVLDTNIGSTPLLADNLNRRSKDAAHQPHQTIKSLSGQTFCLLKMAPHHSQRFPLRLFWMLDKEPELRVRHCSPEYNCRASFWAEHR
eukprot:TRINITY_DN11393_c0_g1_i2.p1 TRINITY_DN11393_c0_g1~~TRINITY_DN11393_c0_g1_i2.p1  ORF type:complete len:100 (+),score=4.26 TRINITY_DN11393_c0_g1_i2:45-344(+)